MRLAVYGCVSSILAIGVVLSAMHQRSNFYAACIYLSKSSACMMILLNMGFIISVLFGRAVQQVFFGRLRAIEVEHLYERSWYAITETCLAMTIFREDFDLQFIVVFTTLLFLKIFHWLCQDRVEFMEQSPTNRVTFHVRIVNLLALLLIIDALLANHAIHVTLTKGPNMMIMFGFEYTILICSILSTIGRYALNVIDMRTEQTWEGKSMYVFYLDLVTDFFKLVTYLAFFVYICLNYQLPLHIIRDVYITFRSFLQKCRDLYRYRRATRNMNELYPNATQEDLTRSSDSTCIICREEMQVITEEEIEDNPEAAAYRGENGQNLDQPKKLPCGHIFHFHCLRSWLERQQTCPTCRRSVLAEANQSADASQQPQQPQDQNQQQQPLQDQMDPLAQQQPPLQQQSFHQHRSFQAQNTDQPIFNSFTETPILTPLTTANQSSQHLNIPGLIPLVPFNTHLPFTDNSTDSIPLNLSDHDLQTLSTSTREAMEQRLKVLQAVQNQILKSMETLASVLSVLPETTAAEDVQQNTNTATTTTTSTQNMEQTQNPTATTMMEQDEDVLEAMEDVQHTGSNYEISERQKEKMPDYSATL